MKRHNKVITYLQIFIGCVGSIAALIGVIAFLIFTSTAVSTVDSVFDPLDNAFSSANERVDSAVESVETADDLSRLDEAASQLAPKIDNVNERLKDITDNSLYSNLPVNFASIAERVDSASVAVNELDELLDNSSTLGTEIVKGRAKDKLGEIIEQIDAGGEKVSSVGDSLVRWVRVAGLAGVLVSVIHFWAFASLTRVGLSKDSKKPNKYSEESSLRVIGAGLKSLGVSKTGQSLGAITGTLITVGSVFYHFVEGLSWLDSIYFSVITLTTVGFGDFSPETSLGKVFTIGYVIVGIGILVAFVSEVAKHIVKARKTND